MLPYPNLFHCTPPHSHSIVLVESNELIFLCKAFPGPESFRRTNRQMHTAFGFKEEFCHLENSSLSGTIGTDRVIS
jgi:hypothetical protein